MTSSEDRQDITDARTGGSRLLSRRCATCVLKTGNPIYLEPGRLRRLLGEALPDGYIVCHDTVTHGPWSWRLLVAWSHNRRHMPAPERPLPSPAGGWSSLYFLAARAGVNLEDSVGLITMALRTTSTTIRKLRN